ncbi:peptidoglycan-associated lipoprotein Pal [Yersinia enterocolitica]|uniref:peptidoglycan-associated lipoprotein Pal n=1 Tax=Yersinia enterocolitica TaxID=630 RepID=UPI0002F854CC|nr:peptidoglycan-associated lipoprotein Pal [Yersinia enterocolitica]
MQLNKVLKGLMLALPVLAVAACSSNKSANNDQSGMGAGTGTENGSNLSSEEQARLQMQELQKNNIVYFGFDKYDIGSDFAQMLDAHAAFLRTFLRSNPSYKVVVEGHADERGTPEYNIALGERRGERRANAVKMYLQGKGVSADQISIVSYGKEKPAVLGHDEAAFAKNRRAVLVY